MQALVNASLVSSIVGAPPACPAMPIDKKNDTSDQQPGETAATFFDGGSSVRIFNQNCDALPGQQLVAECIPGNVIRFVH